MHAFRNTKTAEQIIERLFGPGVNSSDRCDYMVMELIGCDRAIFWEVFQALWPSCDDTWQNRYDLIHYLREHQPFASFVTEKNKVLFHALGDEVTIYRGASRRRSRGLSWTTSRQVAERFAKGHRGIRVPDAVIAVATVPKRAVLATFTDRQEDEVLIDPAMLPRRLQLQTYMPPSLPC